MTDELEKTNGEGERGANEQKSVSQKPTLDELKKELTERGIKFSGNSKYDTLEKQLAEAMKKGEKPKRRINVIVKGKALDIPLVKDVPCGNRTTQDHEYRITQLEIAAGIKKIETKEVE